MEANNPKAHSSTHQPMQKLQIQPVLHLLSYDERSYNVADEERQDDEEWSAEEKAIDDWLPITSSRYAQSWHSAFHNVTAMVGAGVLILPYAVSHPGWGPGVRVMALSWAVSLYTLWQMVEMHEMVPRKRLDRYHELGLRAFGEKPGLWIVVPQQLLVEVGLNIVYTITGGTSLKKFHDLVCTKCRDIRLTSS